MTGSGDGARPERFRYEVDRPGRYARACVKRGPIVGAVRPLDLSPDVDARSLRLKLLGATAGVVAAQIARHPRRRGVFE